MDVPIVDVGKLFGEVASSVAQAWAIEVCANLVAAAIGGCAFRTYVGGKERKSAEWYHWNVEPNRNQNSSEFLRELVSKLLTRNEALVVETSYGGEQQLWIADSWQASDDAIRERTYTDVVVGGMTMTKKFRERDVLHFKLNDRNAELRLNMMTAGHAQMIEAARKCYIQSSGQKIKVHIGQIESGKPGFRENLKNQIEKTVKPWISNPESVLPEFDGYDYKIMDSSKLADHKSARDLINDVLDMTAQTYMIPPVLLRGDVAGTKDAMQRFLTFCIDPICAMLEEEINRKRYGRAEMENGNYLHIDTTMIEHFDLIGNADKIERLVGSGVYSINDILEAVGGERINEDWADRHWLTLNISNIAQAATAAETAGGGVANGSR